MTDDRIVSIAKNRPTPFYLFDIGKLRSRLLELRRALPPKVDLCYAVKANPFLVKEISSMVNKLEICSPGELRICQRLQAPEGKFVLSGVYKEQPLMEQIVSEHGAACTYTVESLSQFSILRKAAAAANRRIPLLLRLTSGNQFGLNPQEIEEILSLYREDKFLELRGIQYFSGTQKTSLKRLRREIQELDGFLVGLHGRLGFQAQELEFGPGFPVTYFGEDSWNEQEYFREFSSLLENMWFPGKITLELGRSIAACCGTYVTRIVDMKSNQAGNFAIVDGGVHHLVYYGQSMGMRRPPVRRLPAREETDPQLWNICGALCTIHDILVKQLPLDLPQPGDLLVFENAGAYCMTEGISLFLSRDLPEVILVDENGGYRTVRHTTPIDFLNTPSY